MNLSYKHLSITWTNFLRFIFTCSTVLSTSHALILSFIGFPKLSQWTSFFSGQWGTCTHVTITFTESSGLILGVLGIINMDGSLFYQFNCICETEVEISCKILEGSTSNNYKLNFWRKHELKNVICINTTVLGNDLKTKTKTPQCNFPSFTAKFPLSPEREIS